MADHGNDEDSPISQTPSGTPPPTTPSPTSSAARPATIATRGPENIDALHFEDLDVNPVPDRASDPNKLSGLSAYEDLSRPVKRT